MARMAYRAESVDAAVQLGVETEQIKVGRSGRTRLATPLLFKEKSECT